MTELSAMMTKFGLTNNGLFITQQNLKDHDCDLGERWPVRDWNSQGWPQP